METPHSLIASSSSSSSSSNNYDVFLSFRGEIRNNFTSHLYEALRQKGIHTFRDDDGLRKGKPISSELLRAIEGSQCSVVILSSDYASSRWCLDELVKILQCMNDAGQIVLPIFYHVDPCHVRSQTGSVGDAFRIPEQKSPEKVQTWRSALREVGNLAGSHLNGDRNEADFIKDFVNQVSSGLIPRLKISKDLVGMDSRLRKLSVCVSESSFIGICGMGGMGKTTLARAYFEATSDQYVAGSFLANVRERCGSGNEGLVKLQSQLLSDILKEKREVYDVDSGKGMIISRLCRKKVLVILDDVDHRRQIQGLAERKDWFGDGSRVILTTRDGSLLAQACEEYVIYEVDKLEKFEAQQLFSGKAFKGDCPKKDYEQLSDEFIRYANGLPLALEVLGSHLRGKTLNEWESAWNRLKEDPHIEIMEVLLISFNGLAEKEKNIFLDIACLFIGEKKCDVTEIMDSCGFHGEIGIRTLLDKSLLHRDHDDKLRMHDLLKEMGMKIATGELGNEPRRRIRIFDEDDFEHVINSDTGIEEVEAMAWYCDFHSEGKKENVLRALSKMRKLRLLIVSCDSWDSDKGWNSRPDLPNELRHFQWGGFPFNCFPPSFHSQGLVESQLCYRQIEPMKLFWRFIKKKKNKKQPFWNLKCIKLALSPHIRKLADFSSFPNLEKLILDWCENLEEIHPSIAGIGSLTLLSLYACFRLKSLPTSVHGLKSLKVLNLEACKSLRKLPKDLGRLSKLEELNLSLTSIKDVTSSISGLKALKKLELCSYDLWDGATPDDLGGLVSLEHLDLSWNDFSCLPASINRLSKLRHLDLVYCDKLRSLDPKLPDSLEMVTVDGCRSLHTFLDPLKPCNLRCSATCLGCDKLVERQGSKRTAITSLGRHLQKPFIPQSKRFDILLPTGDVEIPSWFAQRSWGSSPSIRLPLHPNWCNNDWMGFALCVCYATSDGGNRKYWQIKINDRDWGFGHVEALVEDRCDGDIRLWILYLPRDEYFRTEWQKFVGQIEFSLRRPLIDLEERNIIGARLVYKQDIKELNQTAPREPLETQAVRMFS